MLDEYKRFYLKVTFENNVCDVEIAPRTLVATNCSGKEYDKAGLFSFTVRLNVIF